MLDRVSERCRIGLAGKGDLYFFFASYRVKFPSHQIKTWISIQCKGLFVALLKKEETIYGRDLILLVVWELRESIRYGLNIFILFWLKEKV